MSIVSVSIVYCPSLECVQSTVHYPSADCRNSTREFIFWLRWGLPAQFICVGIRRTNPFLLLTRIETPGFPSSWIRRQGFRQSISSQVVIMGLDRVIYLFVCVHNVLSLPQSNSIDFSEDRQSEVDNYARVVQEYCKNRPSNEYFRLTAESNCRSVFIC